jgi:tRNA (guanosine-2'-O-)-methyltransferase
MSNNEISSIMSPEEADAFIQHLLEEGIISEDERLVWDMIVPERLKRMYDVLSQRTRYISILMEAVDDKHNQSAVIRSAEAFGIQDIYVVRGKAEFEPNDYITKSADKWVTIEQKTDIETAIGDLQSQGYQVLASYLGDDSRPLEDIDLSKPTVLLFGNEHSGVSEKAIELTDGKFIIPMHGFVQSLNISVAAAISMYEVTNRAKEVAGPRYYLTLDEKKKLYFQWMMDTLNPRVRKMVEKKLQLATGTRS